MLRETSELNKEEIISGAHRFARESTYNYISAGVALSPDYTGIMIFDLPIFAFGPADDDIYLTYKSPDIIGEHFMSPLQLLPEAKTVISFFLPYSDRIKSANAQNYDWPAEEWLHGRFEGQVLVKELSIYIQRLLTEAGHSSLVPLIDPRFTMGDGSNNYTSNWSERHAAYACGLGTFGLSKGLITEKGVCGRFGSVLTQLGLPADTRRYEGVYEYCIKCGACIPHCPVHAISIENGKRHDPCSGFLDHVRDKCAPRYGCGKCQVNVPCESRIPDMRLTTAAGGMPVADETR